MNPAELIRDYVLNRKKIVNTCYKSWPLSEMTEDFQRLQINLKYRLTRLDDLKSIHQALVSYGPALTALEQWLRKINDHQDAWRQYIRGDGSSLFLNKVRNFFKVREYKKIRETSFFGRIDLRILFFPSELFGFKKRVNTAFQAYKAEYDKRRADYNQYALYTSAGLEKSYDALTEAIETLGDMRVLDTRSADRAIAELGEMRHKILEEMYERLKKLQYRGIYSRQINYGDEYYFDDFFRGLHKFHEEQSITVEVPQIDKAILPGSLTQAMSTRFLNLVKQPGLSFNKRTVAHVEKFCKEAVWPIEIAALDELPSHIALPEQAPWFRLWSTTPSVLHDLKRHLEPSWARLVRQVDALKAGQSEALNDCRLAIATIKQILSMFKLHSWPWWCRKKIAASVSELEKEIKKVSAALPTPSPIKKEEPPKPVSTTAPKSSIRPVKVSFRHLEIDQKKFLMEKKSSVINRQIQVLVTGCQVQIDALLEVVRLINALIDAGQEGTCRLIPRREANRWRESLLNAYESLLKAERGDEINLQSVTNLLIRLENLCQNREGEQFISHVLEGPGLFSTPITNICQIEIMSGRINRMFEKLTPGRPYELPFQKLVQMLPKIKAGMKRGAIKQSATVWRNLMYQCYWRELMSTNCHTQRCEQYESLIGILKGCGLDYPHLQWLDCVKARRCGDLEQAKEKLDLIRGEALCIGTR